MNSTEQGLDFFLSSRFASHRYPINTATFITLYSTMAVIGFIENAIIFTTLLANGDMRHGTAANVFVGALTVSDMILCVFNVPTQARNVFYFLFTFIELNQGKYLIILL